LEDLQRENMQGQLEPGLDPAAAMPVLAASRVFTCQCGRPVFFRNSRCVVCGTALGYDPHIGTLLPLQPEGDALWRRYGHPNEPPLYRRCANASNGGACNWLLTVDGVDAQGQMLCRSCRLNRTIPDLALPENAALWGRVETAKRRLVSTLIGLQLPVRSLTEDPQRGLAFDVLSPQPGGPAPLTGHDKGIITLNLDEADDAKRESTRVAMHESYRTLLGHLRHEVGHYYWQRLVDGGGWLAPYRELFGDERQDYAFALKNHYDNGPAPNWRQTHVSAYASSHPWEDWAETWAHYMHMVDTLDTAGSFGLDTHVSDLQYERFDAARLYDPNAFDAQRFLDFINRWVELTGVLNELSRSMGLADFYPFVLSAPAVAKLQFIHLVIAGCAQDTTP
jgi:hypothetical protein